MVLLVLSLSVGIRSPAVAQNNSVLGMDVREALRLMRLAGAYLDMADADRACAIYDRVLERFPTWWIALTGRVRCGVVRREDPEKLRPMLSFAQRFGGPMHVIGKLTKTLELARTDPEEARKEFIVTEPAEPPSAEERDSNRQEPKKKVVVVSPPEPITGATADLFLKAWSKGELRSVIKMVQKAGPLQDVSTGVLRIAVEAGFLLNDGPSLDQFAPELLRRVRNRSVLVRYLRNLKKRNKTRAHRTWLRVWERWVSES